MGKVEDYIRDIVSNQLKNSEPIGKNIKSFKTKKSYFGNKFTKDDKILFVTLFYPESADYDAEVVEVSDKELHLFEKDHEVINGRLYKKIIPTFSDYIESIGRNNKNDIVGE